MAYYIIAYDVSVERVNKFCNLLRQYLTRVQNSLFEGELTRSQYFELENKLKELVKGDDSVRVYKARTEKALRKRVIGKDKTEGGQILFSEDNINE